MKLTFWNHQKAEDIAKEIGECIESFRRRLNNNGDGICCNDNGNGNGNDNVNDNVKDNENNIEIWFSQTIFDPQILSALKELFIFIQQTRQQFEARQQLVEPESVSSLSRNKNKIIRPIIISRLQLDRCEGNQYANESIKYVLEYDVVQVLCVDGQIGSYDLFKSLTTMASQPSPIHLKELDIRFFEISVEDLRLLSNGILNPALRQIGGGLERLSCCNLTFKDDAAVQEFAQVLSQLSQKRHGENPNGGRYLETLWLYYCNLEDQHLQTILKSLITVNVAKNKNIVETETIQSKIKAMSVADYKDWRLKDIRGPLDTDIACGMDFAQKGNVMCWKMKSKTSPVVIESTLKSLAIEQARCGAPFFRLLGAWLLDCETPFLAPTTCRSLCSLETINIFMWEAVQTRTSIDPIEPLVEALWKSRETENNNSIKTNTRLKKLCLSGVDDTTSLGRLVSEHLLGLENLKLHSHGSTDDGMDSVKFSNFVSASLQDNSGQNPKPKNFVLRDISFHCADKPTRLHLESCKDLENLLHRYPMLHDVKFGFKRNAFARQQDGEPSNVRVQQLKSMNAAGSFLFIPTETRPKGLPMCLWPTVLVRFHKRNRIELESLMDEDLQRWVESGSMGGDDLDGADLDSDSEDENDLDDYDDDEPQSETNALSTNPSQEDPRVVEKTASAIFGLLRPNMERFILLVLEKEKRKSWNEKQLKPQSSEEAMKPSPIPPSSQTIKTFVDPESYPRQNKRAGETATTTSPRKIRRAVSGD